MSVFGSELFQYITTLVPYWRVSDDAWRLGNDDSYLTGIEVLRNYGGSAMVIPWDENRRKELSELGAGKRVNLSRLIVVVDDRVEDWRTIEDIMAPIAVLPWSRRDELAVSIIKDSP
jgi:hypothetical protein